MAGPTIQLAGGGGRRIGGHHPCMIVAEIGQNHQGDVDIAKQMIDMAKVSGSARPSRAARCVHTETLTYFRDPGSHFWVPTTENGGVGRVLSC